MLISPAYANDFVAKTFGSSDLINFLPIILIFAVFYLLLIRPQQKRLQTHKRMVANINRGDKVVTGGGLIATVTKVMENDEIQLEIAPDIRVRALRSSISAVLSNKELKENTSDQEKPKI